MRANNTLDRPLYIRRRSRRVDHRPALVWFSLTLLLLALVGVGLVGVRTLTGEWLELKMESARYRLLELVPQPERPDYVPTPALALSSDTGPIRWKSAVSVPTVTTAGAGPQEAAVAPTAALPQSTAVPAIAQPQPEYVLNAIQPAVQLSGVIHEPQRFNNCGPTTLRMYLSYFGYTQDSQVDIANVLKPHKEDRNVSPDELVGYARSKGFHAIARVNGTLDHIKQALSNGLPIMIEEGYDPERAHSGWMGHYLLITGYDAEGITAQDSYNGPNQRFPWQTLDANWRHFNRTYILLYTQAQDPMVRTLVGADLDDTHMYAAAAERAEQEWRANPQDAFAAFNLGSSLVGLSEYQAAAEAFDRARLLKLPWRMLWYQFGPYEAYYQTGRYQEVVELAEATQKPVGDLEESYYYKALALDKLGRIAEAREALRLALQYNPNYQAAQRALSELGS